MKIWLVIKYYLMNISFKLHRDPSFRGGDMAKICSAGIFAPPPEPSAQDPPLDRVNDLRFMVLPMYDTQGLVLVGSLAKKTLQKIIAKSVFVCKKKREILS